MSRAIRFAALATLAVFTSTFLSSCSPAPKTDKLVIWVDQPEADALQNASDRFEKDTGVKVELVIKDNSRAEFLSDQSTAAKPDIIAGGHDFLGETGFESKLLPIDLGLGAGNFGENALQAFSADGKLWGVPYSAESAALICREDQMPNAPTDFAQVLDAGFEMLYFAGQGAIDLYGVQSSFGATIFASANSANESTALNLGGEAGDKFAQWLASNGESFYSSSPSYDGAINALKEGSKACWLAGPYVATAIDLRSQDYKIYPVPPAGDKPATPFLTSRGFMISATTKDAAISQRFITDYALTKEVVKAIYQATNRIPTLNAAVQDLASDPVASGFAAAAKSAVALPVGPAMTKVYTPWSNAEVAILNQRGDAIALWRQMVSELEAQLQTN